MENILITYYYNNYLKYKNSSKTYLFLFLNRRWKQFLVVD